MIVYAPHRTAFEAANQLEKAKRLLTTTSYLSGMIEQQQLMLPYSGNNGVRLSRLKKIKKYTAQKSQHLADAAICQMLARHYYTEVYNFRGQYYLNLIAPLKVANPSPLE